MGAFSRQHQPNSLRAELSLIRNVKGYTMYRRGSLWYVNFRAGDKQYRFSLGLADYEQARILVESYRSKGSALPQLYSDRHLFRMIERARYRNRKKGVPFAIGINHLRDIVAQAGGRCVVSGRPMEDAGPFQPSLDRINPAEGYVPGNIRIVCLIVNTAMLHYGETAFGEIAISYCRRLGLLNDAPV